MARATTRLGILALSALLCTTALAAAPEQTPAPATAQSLDEGIRDAQARRAGHDYAGAVRVLSQLMLVAPDDARVVGEYGKVLVQQGRSREAVEFLTRSTELSPGDWTLYSALGIAYDQMSDFNGARAAYDHALSIKPSETVVLNNYAMSRMLAGDLPQARRLIAQAAVNSKDERIARNVALINGLPAPAVASVPAPAKAAASNLAQSTPRPLTPPGAAAAGSPNVVVQAVPHDPMARPAAKTVQAVRVIKPSKTAKKPALQSTTATAAATQPAAASKSGIPALRLANDRQ